MTILVTLTAAGTSTTLFNLYSNLNYVTPLVTGITKAALLAGYSLNSVPDSATSIRVTATGVCTNSIDIAISGLTTTSTSSTSSTSTSSTTSTTTLPTTSTSTSSTTSTTTLPTTTSSSTTTTTAPPTTSTTTTTTTANPSGSLFFDASTGVGGYSVTAIDVNGVTPTLTSGTNVPFSMDGHGYDTNQTGSNETLNITIGGFTLNGCIQVTDSEANYYQQNVTGNGTISFTGLVINNTTTVQIVLADSAC
jgi:hypothetical protein